MSIINSVSLFKNNQKELKELSKDTANNEYLTESTHEAVDFDTVKTRYANSCHKSEDCMKSVDALIELGEIIILIEFKNEKVAGSEIRNKIRDSLLLLTDVLKTDISETRKTMEFILVYNKEKNKYIETQKIQFSKSRDIIVNYVTNKAGNELIGFKLDKYVDIYFRNVHTYNEKEFKNFLIENKIYF